MEAERAVAFVRDERGFALPIVIGVVLVAFTFASVAAVAAVSNLNGTVREEGSKSALGAADAGAAAALARQNTLAGTGSTPCLQPGSGGLLVQSAVQADGWCAPVTGSIDGGTYSYQVYPGDDGTVEIVSTGSSDQVDRRIELSARSETGGLFSDAQVKTLDGITLDSNAEINTSTASNGSITLSSNARLCGSASVGIGENLIKQGSAASGPSHGGSGCPQSSYPFGNAPLTLPLVQQGDAPTNNSNGRFFGQDLLSKSPKYSWDPSARALELKSNTELSLGGDKPYSFCTLKLNSNSHIYINAGATVQIFFDSPENCGLPSGTTQLEMESNSSITPTAGNPTHVAILFVGSDTLQTKIQLNSNSQADEACSSDFVIYAPKTDIDTDSNARYCGAIAGKSLHMDSNARFFTSSAVDDFVLPGAGPHFVAERFVECDTTSTGTPSQGC